jgi:hypothetical protein
MPNTPKGFRLHIGIFGRRARVPITICGMTIAYSLGIFERALAPFPSALELLASLKVEHVQRNSR